MTVTITFGEELEAAGSSDQSNSKKLSEGDDWGREVSITVDTLLCDPDSTEGCVDILDE